MFLKPPFDSVPSLMRPVWGTFCAGSNFCQVPSSMVPSTYAPVTKQLVISRFSVLSCITQRITALGNDGIIPRRVHRAIRDPHIPATIDIHAVAIGVDRQSIDGQVIYPGG